MASATRSRALRPMLGKLTRELPREGYLYEPKWDGFRCLAFRDGAEVELRSRHGRPLGRYFPELVQAALALKAESFILDGEIVLIRDRVFDFPALMSRLHPAPSRVEMLSAAQPAQLIAFDLLALGRENLTGRPFRERRRLLERLIAKDSPTLRLTPLSEDPDEASKWLRRYPGGGIDGVMAKDPESPYRPGARAMLKVKRELTADCVVAGYRLRADRPELGSLLLGLYDEAGALRHVGVAGGFGRARGAELLADLRPLATTLAGHPWEHGFLLEAGPTGRLAGAAGRWLPGEMVLDWVPLRAERVCEVAYEQLDQGRFRHPARFRRWRPDREPRSCRLDQLTVGP